MAEQKQLKPRTETKKKMRPITKSAFHDMLNKAAVVKFRQTEPRRAKTKRGPKSS